MPGRKDRDKARSKEKSGGGGGGGGLAAMLGLGMDPGIVVVVSCHWVYTGFLLCVTKYDRYQLK